MVERIDRARWPRLAAAMAMLLAPGSAIAVSCESSDGYTRLTGPEMSSLLVGSLACYPATPPYENQEAITSGKIIEYKKGPKDPIDPSMTVGSYTMVNGSNPTITFAYANGPSYVYSIWGKTTSGSGVYDLCAGRSPLTIRVVAGSNGPC